MLLLFASDITDLFIINTLNIFENFIKKLDLLVVILPYQKTSNYITTLFKMQFTVYKCSGLQGSKYGFDFGTILCGFPMYFLCLRGLTPSSLLSHKFPKREVFWVLSECQ